MTETTESNTLMILKYWNKYPNPMIVIEVLERNTF